MNCRIIYKDNKIDHVQAENGERSILFDSLKDIFGAEKALELYALTEEDVYKQKIQEKVRSFVGVTEKQIDKLSEVIDAQETLNKLVETGLADNVYQMTSEELKAKLVELGVEADVAKQVVAYHGSPYSFDRFTTEKMGTGEGAQAFGWGLYFTDLEGIARKYAKDLADSTLNNYIEEFDNKLNTKYENFYDIVNNLSEGKFLNESWRKEADKLIKEEIEFYKSEYKDVGISSKEAKENLKLLNELILDINNIPNRNLYKVSLHKGKQPSEYTWLEWDKEVSKRQLEDISRNVLDKTLAINTTGIFQFQKNGVFYRGKKTNNKWNFTNRNTGEAINYNEVSNAWQELYNQEVLNKKEFKFYKRLEDFLESDKNASLFLLKSGIDGIKYPAESISRGATSDTARGFNYVVFDENAITIEEQIQFQKSGITPITNGFIHNNDVYLNKDTATEETEIHEFNHLYNKWLKQNRPEVYKKGLSLIKKELKSKNSEIKEVIDFVKTNQPNLKGDTLLEEILTELVGRKGLELLIEQKDKTKSSGIINWLSEVWQSIKDMLGLSSYTDEQILNMNLQDFANASAIDLLRGENIGTSSENSNDVRYQVIGEKGASKIEEYSSKLNSAKELEKQGESIDEIVNKTGWYKQNNQWKYLAPELLEQLKLIDNYDTNTIYKLQDILQDKDTLLQMYPEMGNIKVVFYDNSAKNTLPETKNWTNSEGAYNSEKNILGINTGRLGERGDFGLIQRKFAHELTHSIQREEGFPVGGGLFTIFNEVKKLVGIDGSATVKTVIDAINNMDRSNLNKSQNRILDEGIKATMAIFYNDTEVLNRQYKHILGEVDAKLVEDVMKKIQEGEKITLSYNQYLQLFSEQDNIDLSNLFILNNGDIQFSLTPEIKKPTSLKIEYNVTPQTSTNYANLTEDGEGNFVFYHVGAKGYDVIKRGTGQNKATSREEATAINRVGGVAMYYPAENVQESMFSGEAKYLIKVPQEKVYDFNRDALNLLDEAEQMFRKQFPNQAFDKNSKLAFVTKVANEKGFDAVVANWDSTTRVQTTKELKPLDEQITEGNKITKDFSAENKFKSNRDKGWEVVPTVMQSKLLKDVYDKIETLVGNDFSNPLYRVREMAGYTFEDRFAPFKSQDEITDVVEKSNLPQEVKDEYNKAITSQDKPGYSKLTKKPSLKIEVKEVNGRLVVEPLVNGTKAGALRMLPYEDGYRVDSVAVYDKYQNKRLGTRLYQEAIKFLLKSQTPLYSLKVRSENAKKIWDKFVEIGVAQKVGEDYIAPNKGGLDKNNEATPSDVMQYANTTDEKLSKEETAEAIDLAVSLGVESSQEAVAILKDAFLENNSFVFDKKKMKKAGYNDYEITKILTDVNLQNQIKNNLAKLENTDFSAPLMDVQTSPEIGIFGKQKVKPKVKTVNVKTVNEQGEVVDKVSDTKELLRKTYPDTLPNDMPQIASSLFKSSENVVNTHNDLFYNTLNDLKNVALDLGVDLKDIENRVFPLENFKSFVNSLMEYYANPSDAFAEVYDEFFENYGAEKATKPTMSTPYTEYELFDKFNLVRKGDEYVKVEDVEIEPSAERQAKITQLEVEDFAVDFDKLEKLVYHKEQLGAEMKTLQKPLIEEINLKEVKKNPYLKATSEGVKLVSEDPLTAQKAELYGYEPKVAEKQPKKIETDYSLVQDVLVTQLTSENKVKTPKGNFTKFMDDNNKSVFLLDGSKQKEVDLEGYLSKADNTPKIEAKKLYSKEEFENNFGCV